MCGFLMFVNCFDVDAYALHLHMLYASTNDVRGLYANANTNMHFVSARLYKEDKADY